MYNISYKTLQQYCRFNTTNATGSFENNAITAGSSTSKMGAVITYQG